MPTLNDQLIDEVLENIKNPPPGFRWNQGTWYEDTEQCGTSLCFAGWAAYLTDAEFVIDSPHFIEDDSHTAEFVCPRGSHREEHVSDYAQRVLGLTDDEAGAVFYSGTSSIYEMELIVHHIRAARAAEEKRENTKELAGV